MTMIVNASSMPETLFTELSRSAPGRLQGYGGKETFSMYYHTKYTFEDLGILDTHFHDNARVRSVAEFRIKEIFDIVNRQCPLAPLNLKFGNG